MGMRPILPIAVTVKKIKGAHQCQGDDDRVVRCERALKTRDVRRDYDVKLYSSTWPKWYGQKRKDDAEPSLVRLKILHRMGLELNGVVMVFHTEQNQDREREQMGCMILCRNVRIVMWLGMVQGMLANGLQTHFSYRAQYWAIGYRPQTKLRKGNCF